MTQQMGHIPLNAPMVSPAPTADGGAGLLAPRSRRRCIQFFGTVRFLRLNRELAAQRSGRGDVGNPRRRWLLVRGQRWRRVRLW